jgi:adhesin transport system outer membrane protein
MRYNLYRGGADQARRQETAERMETAKEMVRRTQRNIEKEVRLSWNNLTTIRTRLEHLKAHVESSGQVLHSYEEQHRLGQRSLLDVLDSENELFNARSALVTGKHTEWLGRLKVLASMGMLLKTLGIKQPQEAEL